MDYENIRLDKKDHIVIEIEAADYLFKLPGGMETIRRYFLEDENNDFADFVDALNVEARR